MLPPAFPGVKWEPFTNENSVDPFIRPLMASFFKELRATQFGEETKKSNGIFHLGMPERE